MRPVRRHRPAGSAKCRIREPASRPFLPRKSAKTRSCGGSARHNASPRKVCGQSSEFPPALDAILAVGVDDRDEPDDAAVTTIPVPREIGERATFARDLVDIAADVLDAEDAVVEQNAMH